MIVTVNGDAREIPAQATVAVLVAELGDAGNHGNVGRGIAVAVGGVVVPRTEWERRSLSDGDTVEVLVAVQGG